MTTMKHKMRLYEFGTGISGEDLRKASWVKRNDQPGQNNEDISVYIHTAHRFQTMDGLGGAFSELGWTALQALSDVDRSDLMNKLFSPALGAGFAYCRLPVGASDFAHGPYSLDDVDGDLAMECFSVERDEQHLIPFIQAARRINPDLCLHASPWSPPAWMKTNKSMINGGELVDAPRIYAAYALYLRKFVDSYAAHGIHINRLLVQNEPDSTAAFPSCVMHPEQMIRFVVEYLRPEFDKAGLTTEIWGGTYRTMANDLYAQGCMADARFRDAVGGCGFQYSYPDAIRDLRELHPGTRVMHTESCCFDGNNTVLQSAALFEDFLDYIGAGCGVFSYWNMVLDEVGKSHWDWRQNSLVTVDRQTGRSVLNPDYNVMALLSAAIRPGAQRVQAFCFSTRVVAFRQPDGTTVVLLHNSGEAKTGTFSIDGRQHAVELPARSLVALSFDGSENCVLGEK